MSNEQLFTDFQGFSKTDWKQKMEADLNGKPYLDLCSTNGANVFVEPIYTSEDVEINNESPGAGSYRRGSKTTNNEWAIDEQLELTGNAKADNKNILERLNSGITSLTLSGICTKETLEGVLAEHVKIGFTNYSDIFDCIYTIQTVFGVYPNNYQICVNYDPIGAACLNGYWNQILDIEGGTEAVHQLLGFSQSRVFTVSGQNYHNAGGNAVSELAFSLAHGHEYLIAQMEKGFSVDDASARIKVDLASGGDYFLEIAKIRAFRILWAKMLETYKPKHSCSKSILIHSHTSQFLSTLYDPYVNMLRSTTQAMSAVLGGCDILTVLPYNTAWGNGDNFSSRIARNVQLLLKEESYFDKVIDPAGGSYYIENLTENLAKKAWNKFKKIEKKGGFIGLMESGNLNRELKEDAQIQLDKLSSGNTKVLGINIFPNKEEKMLSELMEMPSSLKPSRKAQKFDRIELIRLVGKLEEKRLKTELREDKL